MKTPLMSSKSGGKAPHCKVCGDDSSGFHYGVDSCEGCKGFFRRCITQGMNHKCANEEKCEITPFTRNSCQYCRLKKCFEVGMSREASRLGRRPKRLKEVGGDGSGGTRSHTSNLPIAPYPSPQELYKLRMAELQKILQTNGTFKAELMQAFLSAAKASFQEHSKSGAAGSGDGHAQNRSHTGQKQVADISGTTTTLSPSLSGTSPVPTTTSMSEMPCTSAESAGLNSAVGMSGVDSPSSLHSPGGSMIDFSNLAALDSFLFEQSLPSTPGGAQQNSMDAVAELQALNSPFNLNSAGLDPVSAATSPLSEMGTGSPLVMSSASLLNSGGGSLGSDPSTLHDGGLNNNNLLNLNISASSICATSTTPSQTFSQTQQYQYQLQPVSSANLLFPGLSSDQVKTELSNAPFSSTVPIKTEVKDEPLSPETPTTTFSVMMSPGSSVSQSDNNEAEVNVAAIMEEVRQTPSEDRRLLIEQVTDAVVEAHLATTINTYKAVEDANRRISEKEVLEDVTHDMSKLRLEASTMWQQFVSAMVPEITKLVRFCKKLPGFAEIEQDDQIRLIKQGSFEVLLARFSMLVDHQSQTMIDPTLSMRSPRHVIREMPMGEFLDEFFFVSSQFNPLKLTDGEIGIFCSILIICPTRKGLRNKRAISKIQSLFQQALYFLMKHNHPDPDQKFRQLMGLISIFHRINGEHFKALNNIRMKSPEEFSSQFPELHREIFDTTE